MPEQWKIAVMPSNLASTSNRSDSKLDQFLNGIVTPIRAVGVIVSSPKLITWSAFPIFTMLVVLSVVFYCLMAGLWTWITTHFTGFFAGYHSALMAAVGVIAGLIFIYAVIQSLAILTSLVASPFNDFLAESAERELGVVNVPGFTFKRALRVFFLDLRKTCLSLILSLILSLCLLIPVVGIAAFIGIALLTTFTFITYPQSRRELGVWESFRWVRSEFPSSMGFGLTSALMFTIPVINIFALPICVVGGTLLYLERTHPELLK